MAEEASLALSDVETGLRELIAAELVEYDPETRVARLTVLHDRLHRPDNGNMIRGWWSRFRTFPACAVRDRHVATLRWLIGDWTEDHVTAWSEGFGPLEALIAANGSINGSGNRSGNGSQVIGNSVVDNGSVNGSANRHGSDLGILKRESPGSHAHSSREIPSVQDPVVGPAADDAMRAWERRRGKAAEQREDVAPLAGEAIRRYGPLAAVPECPSVAGGRYR